MGAALSTAHSSYQVGLGWKDPIFGSLLPGLAISNTKYKQIDVLQGLPAGLAGLTPPIKQLQSSWSIGTCSYSSSTSFSCSIIHEALPGPVSQVPMKMEAWLLGTGGLRRKRNELETRAPDGLLSWEAGTLRVYKQLEALQLDLSVLKPRVAQSQSALDDHILLFRVTSVIVNTTSNIATLYIGMTGGHVPVAWGLFPWRDMDQAILSGDKKRV